MKKEEVRDFLSNTKSVAWYEDMQVAVDPLHEVRFTLYDENISVEFGVTEAGVKGHPIEDETLTPDYKDIERIYLDDEGIIHIVSDEILSV